MKLSQGRLLFMSNLFGIFIIRFRSVLPLVIRSW